MARKAGTTTGTSSKKSRPAQTLEARENQLIALAVDVAEEKLRDGTASSQIITHFLKLGTTREQLEKDILKEQKELVKEKTKSLRESKNMDKMYEDAINALKEYSGNYD